MSRVIKCDDGTYRDSRVMVCPCCDYKDKKIEQVEKDNKKLAGALEKYKKVIAKLVQKWRDCGVCNDCGGWFDGESATKAFTDEIEELEQEGSEGETCME